MASLEFAVAFLLLVLAAAGAAAWLRARLDTQASALRQELQGVLQAQGQAVSGQMAQLSQSVTQQLGQLAQALQQGVAASGQIATAAQSSMTEQLARIDQELGALQQTGRQLTAATQTMEAVLGGAKTRGALGEIALERLLEDALPKATYQTQYRFSTGAIVDAVIRVGDKCVPVDSKFPLDAYRRLAEGNEESRKEFALAVRRHADSIAEKYIVPDEGSLDFALMFVPSEGVYYELLMAEDPRAGRLADYCVSQRVVPVSPNTLYAYLRVILMGLRGMQIEENARRLLGSLAGLKKQFDSFVEVYEKLGTHLRNAQQSYADADGRLERAMGTLGRMAEGALPEAPARALEPATKD